MLFLLLLRPLLLLVLTHGGRSESPCGVTGLPTVPRRYSWWEQLLAPKSDHAVLQVCPDGMQLLNARWTRMRQLQMCAGAAPPHFLISSCYACTNRIVKRCPTPTDEPDDALGRSRETCGTEVMQLLTGCSFLCVLTSAGGMQGPAALPWLTGAICTSYRRTGFDCCSVRKGV